MFGSPRSLLTRHTGPLLVLFFFFDEVGGCLSWSISLGFFFSKTAPRCFDSGIYFFFCSVFKVCGLSEVFEFCHFIQFFTDLLVCLHCPAVVSVDVSKRPQSVGVRQTSCTPH